MTEILNIKKVNGKDHYPNIEEIKKLLESNDNELTLRFENLLNIDKYRKELQKELTKYHVFNLRWMPEIWIYPAIDSKKIIEKKEEIYKTALSFREDSIKLMTILGDSYQINPFEGKELFEFRRDSRKNGQRGKVNEEWNFWFHGAECQFENHKTGQIENW